MRNDIADNLRQLQERLGPDLSGALDSDDEGADAFVSPSVDRGLTLTQIAGLSAGGTFPLNVGSFRFGLQSGPTSLGQGQPAVPRFALTVGADGTVTIVPPSDGIAVDGQRIEKPTVLSNGQIIDAGTASFVVGSATPSLLRRVEESAQEPMAAMPTPTKSRGVDGAIVEWARQGRIRAVSDAKSARLGPAEIDQRSQTGSSAIYVNGPQQPGFGRVAIAIGSTPYLPPGDLSMLNPATRKKLDELGSVAAAPIELDLLSQSLVVVGPGAAARAVIAWVTLCVAAMSRPDALGVRLLARGNRNDWAWVDALPNAETQPGSPLNLIIIDEGSAPSDLPSAGAIVAVEPGQIIPEGAGLVMELGATSATVTDRSSGRVIQNVSPIGVSPVYALGITFQIAEHMHGRPATNNGGSR